MGEEAIGGGDGRDEEEDDEEEVARGTYVAF